MVERFAKDNVRPTRVLIDTSPDMREQLLKANVAELDAVLFSHDHADQTHGIDDLRVVVFALNKRLPVYMDSETARTLTARFSYCFKSPSGSDYPAILELREMPLPGGRLSIEGPGGQINFIPLLQQHGGVQSLGFRFGSVAYSNDVSDMPEESFAALQGLEFWIVDALRYAPHPSHAHVDKMLQWVGRLKPKRTILTNMHIDLDYTRLRSELPNGVEPGFDGLTFEVASDD